MRCLELKAAGSTCANCENFSPYPGPGERARFICDLDSDFYGYAVTTPERVCPRWSAKSLAA